jgi:hypothetical protein
MKTWKDLTEKNRMVVSSFLVSNERHIVLRSRARDQNRKEGVFVPRDIPVKSSVHHFELQYKALFCRSQLQQSFRADSFYAVVISLFHFVSKEKSARHIRNPKTASSES